MDTVPGLADLTGKGVYRGMPKDVPRPVRDGRAVVAGDRARCAAAARQLRRAGWTVTVVTTAGTNLVWASGIDYLEAVVLRSTATGRIHARNASALFILSSCPP
jgi:hypothetical protein